MQHRLLRKQPLQRITATWDLLWQEFDMELQATNRSPRTREAYGLAVKQLRDFLLAMGLPNDDPAIVTAEHVRHFLAEIASRNKPATVNQRYRSLRRFFSWLVTQDERTDNPLERIAVPKVPQRIIPALQPHDVMELLKKCDLKDRLGVRDYAIILVLYDTGLRASEFLSMEIDPTGKYEGVIVTGKGKEREVRLGVRARQAVMRYARVWRLEGKLWLDRHDRPLTRSGLYQLFRRFGTGVYPHLMRHTFATQMLDLEAPSEAVRSLMGHTSDEMLRRYTRSREHKRALEVHRRFSPADRLLG